MASRLESWKKELSEHKNSILISILFLIISVYLNYLAGNFATKRASEAVTDLILDSIPTIDLSFFYIYFPIITVILLIGFPLIYRLNKLHTVLLQFSFLIMVRSFFISLTHLKAPVGAIIIDLPKLFSFLTFGGDLFFSGHTAIPFLGFLIYRKINRNLSIFFFIMTIIMALTVLFMHVHYSIDVFAALFISYGCYKLGEVFLE